MAQVPTLSGAFEFRSIVLIIPAFHDFFFWHCNKFRRGTFLHKNATSFLGLTIKPNDCIGKIDQQLLLHNFAAEFFEHSFKRKL